MDSLAGVVLQRFLMEPELATARLRLTYSLNSGAPRTTDTTSVDVADKKIGIASRIWELTASLPLVPMRPICKTPRR